MNNFLLLGCGNLGNIILEGLLSQNKKVYVFEKKKSITQKLVHKNCLVTNKIDSNLISKIDCILLCTKPVDVKFFTATSKTKKRIPKIHINFFCSWNKN